MDNDKIEIARQLVKDGKMSQEAVDILFPELKESENIKKAIKSLIIASEKNGTIDGVIKEHDALVWLEKRGEKEYALKSSKDEDVHKFVQYIERQAKAYELNLPNRSYDIYGFAKDILSWLEKQGERNTNIHLPSFDEAQGTPIIEKGSQNLANSAKNCKIEPKFKVGDWVIRDSDGFTTSIKSVEDEIYYFHQGGNLFVKNVDECFHLWTIQDAEDGDVLAEHETIVLFKTIEGLNIKCYCTYHYLGYNPTFYVDTLQNKTPYRPATKEQRDKLEKAITKAGYKWDAEKKELKKVEQNPAWSEEDEETLNSILNDLSQDAIPDKEDIQRLKSLKEKYTWKPSDEQLNALENSLGDYNITIFQDRHEILESLYNDLKKLKG